MDLTTLTDAGLHDLSAQIAAEWERRRASAVTEQEVTKVVTDLQDSGKLPAPASGTDAETDLPWVDPGTDHSAMYRQGAYVTHKGKTWLSRHPGLNHWEPGAPGVDGRIWLDVTPDPIEEEPEDEITPPPIDEEPGDEVAPPPIDEEPGDEVAPPPADPEDDEAEEPQIIAWGVGQDVQPGDLRTHDGQTWECILAHTTHEGWAPGPDTHAVWQPA